MSEQEQTGSTDPGLHRGRVQAQGNDMGRTESESWAKATPPTVSEVLALLDQVWNRLSKTEQEAREECYQRARRYIENRQTGGPIDAQAILTFPNRRRRGGIRIDLEVRLGRACVPD